MMYQRSKNLYIVPLAFWVGLTLVFGLALASAKASAESSSASVVVPANYCGITTNAANNTPHTATINAGTYQADIGTTTFKIVCGDSGGFSVYAVGFANSELGNNKLLANINGTLVPSHDILTGTATSGDTSNWAMKLTSVAGTFAPTLENGYGNYSAVPATNTKVATFPSTTDEYQGSSFTATYAAYINQMQPAGTYNGKVKYTMVHPASAVPTNFNDAYAAAGKTKLNGYYTMQDMSASICDAVNVFDEAGETQLIDARDNKIYYVAKMKDGGCWMTQNLDHDISTTFAYTPDNTDIPANWTPDKSTYATGTTTWDTSSTGYNIQQSYDPGNKIWDGVPIDFTSQTLDNMTQGTDAHYHIGNYYNWGAAVAMNNTSAYTTQYQDVNQSICPKGWMLPKSGNVTTAGSFQYLVNQYNWASNSMTNPNMWATPLYFPLAGSWRGSSDTVAHRGVFWSSVVSSSSYAYLMYGNYVGTVNPANYNYRYYGLSVRCVAREAGSTPGYVPTSLNDMTTMQQMTPEICAATAVGTTATLRDTRDNSTYSVAKLADNKCWMTQNMRLDFSKLVENISADNTNNPSANFKNSANTKPSANNSGAMWCTTDSSACDDQLRYNTANIGSSSYDKYGVYYNWYTATAGNGTYSTSTNGTNVAGDICPKGWHLPTGGSGTNTDFYLLNQAINSGSTSNPSGLMSAPANFLYSGYVNASVSGRGSDGVYWSSTANSSNRAYTLSFYPSIVYPGTTDYYKYEGFSVRCVR